MYCNAICCFEENDGGGYGDVCGDEYGGGYGDEYGGGNISIV